MALKLEPAERGGDQVLVLRDLRLVIADRVLLEGFDARIKRGEVVGIVGPNGSGKSTLLSAITGERPATAGEARIGEGVTVAHYRQDLAQVPVAKTLYAAINDLRPRWQRGHVQSHLGRFGFSGEEVGRVVGSLSGGEQARLALAMIMLSGATAGPPASANLQLFDEPTNHLDVESIEVLEDALTDFGGTVILVSHDRALLEALTTRTWALYDGRMEDYPGAFDEWAVARNARERAAAAGNDGVEQEARRRGKAQARRAHTERQARASGRRTARRAVEAAEARAHEMEAKVAALTSRLHDASLYLSAEGVAEAAELQADLRMAQAGLDAALEAWAAAEDALAGAKEEP